MSWSLVTGASSGIGREFAKILAAEGYDVILVARRENPLNQLKQQIESQFQQSAQVIVADLSRPEEIEKVYRQTKKLTDQLEILINNAGFGRVGEFCELDLDANLQMIDLNVRALTHLTGLFARDMKQARYGYNCNVASTAAFQPGPGMAVYFATKAFVLSFTEAVSAELRPENVFVSALCPGPTLTEFGEAAQFSSQGGLSKAKLPTAREVAEFGYRCMKQGRASAIHGSLNMLLAQGNRLLPRTLATKLAKVLISKA